MNQTSNYQLSQWDPDDRILRTDFNEDNAKIDAALQASADAVSAEASARASAISSLTTKLNKKGNVQMEIKTYVGTGEYGETNSNRVTFSAKPVLIFISGSTSGIGYTVRDSRYLYTRPNTSVSTCRCSWSGNSFTWSGSSAQNQMNLSGTTYTVVALIDLDE